MPAPDDRFPPSLEELTALVRQWHEALLARDTDTLDLLWADEYTTVNPAGEITTKAEDLAAATSAELELDRLEVDEIIVKEYGRVAVVTSRTTLKGRLRDQKLDGQFRNTMVFVRRARRWQAVAAHSTPLTHS